MHKAAIWREILDAQLEMVCRFRADGEILFANRAYAATLGATPDELTGRSVWDFVTGEDQAGVRESMGRLTAEQTEITIENRLETADGPRWTLWRNHGLEFDEAGALVVLQSTGIDITERRRLEEQTRLLVEELNHRVKNTLMVVQAMAFQSFRGSDIPAEPVAKFNERLTAMAAAHTALSQGNWSGAPIADLVRHATAICGPAFENGAGNSNVRMRGPDIKISAAPTVPLVMVLHELSTNALKYGALSEPQGKVDITWTYDADARLIALDWRESGGPPVRPPTRKGFGSRLISDAVTRQMRGEAKIDYAVDGVSCHITFPLEESAW
jgi:PAS domain S-box-containing protein